MPINDEGWKHFPQGRAVIDRAFVAALDVDVVVRWMPLGEPAPLADTA